MFLSGPVKQIKRCVAFPLAMLVRFIIYVVCSGCLIPQELSPLSSISSLSLQRWYAKAGWSGEPHLEHCIHTNNVREWRERERTHLGHRTRTERVHTSELSEHSTHIHTYLSIYLLYTHTHTTCMNAQLAPFLHPTLLLKKRHI